MMFFVLLLVHKMTGNSCRIALKISRNGVVVGGLFLVLVVVVSFKNHFFLEGGITLNPDI